MLNLTVIDLLANPLFSEFRLISGRGGLYNPVMGTGILEYESFQDIDNTFEKGEFVMTTLSQAKNDPVLAEEQIKYLIKNGACAVAIKTVFYQDIPESVKQYSDDHNTPIFFFGKVYFDDIIYTVKSILASGHTTDQRNEKLARLISGDISTTESLRFATEINPFFYDNLYAVYAAPHVWEEAGEKNFFKELKSRFKEFNKTVNSDQTIYSVIEYNSGIFVIYTIKNPSNDHYMKLVQFINQICLRDIRLAIGISNFYQNKSNIGKALKESIYAHTSCLMNNDAILRFDETGLDQILIPARENPWVECYYNKYLEKIKNYDHAHRSNLLETLIEYVKCEGNIQLTAQKLYQHSNTIRYRMEKLRTLWAIDDQASFYSQAAIFARLYQIYRC